MLKAVAFDFDGVLLESVDVKTRAFRRLFSQESPENIERIARYHLENGGLSRFDKFRHIYQNILGRPLPDAEFNQLCDRFAALVVDEVLGSPWVPGALEFLDAHRNTLRFFVISGTPDAEIKDIVKRRGLASYFSAVLGAPRSKTDLLTEVMRNFGLAPGEIIFVGDARNDWEAARNHGIRFVWRRASPAIPALTGFSGPVISTLVQLEEAIA